MVRYTYRLLSERWSLRPSCKLWMHMVKTGEVGEGWRINPTRGMDTAVLGTSQVHMWAWRSVVYLYIYWIRIMEKHGVMVACWRPSREPPIQWIPRIQTRCIISFGVSGTDEDVFTDAVWSTLIWSQANLCLSIHLTGFLLRDSLMPNLSISPLRWDDDQGLSLKLPKMCEASASGTLYLTCPSSLYIVSTDAKPLSLSEQDA